MSFWGELKRRNVFRVGAAYAIVAWLLVQVVVTVLPTFEAPQWIVQTLILIIILGFPVAILLSWAFEMTPEGIVPASRIPASARSERAGAGRLNGIILGSLALAVGFLIVDRFLLTAEPTLGATVTSQVAEPDPAIAQNPSLSRVRRSYINLGPSERLGDLMNGQLNTLLALSPRGERLAYVLRQEGVEQLFVRELDALAPNVWPLPDDANGTPFFTPDGQRVSVYRGGSIRTIQISTGQAIDTPAEPLRGPKGFLTWIGDDRIVGVLTNFSALSSAIFEYSVSQERIEFLTASRQNSDQGSPQWLPDGEHFIHSAANFRSFGDATVVVSSRTTGEARPIIERAYAARYAPTGHIVFIRDAGLWAVPFDLEALAVSGPEVQLIEAVQSSSEVGKAAYAFSDDGTLVYLPGGNVGAGLESNLVLVDRSGREEVLPFEPQPYTDLRVSPDGGQIAAAISEGSDSDIWIYDLERETRRRLTFDPAVDRNPRWMPDGSRIVFWSERNSGGFFAKAADGSGDAVELSRADAPQIPGEITSDGRELIYAEVVSGNIDNLFAVTLDGQTTVRVLRDTERDEDFVDVSPDGRWLVFEANVPGSDTEVFVTPFAEPDGPQWQVSDNNGADPRWSPDGRELFYLSGPDRHLASVRVDRDVTTSFSYGPETVLFPARYTSIKGFWDIAPDGEHFVFPKPAGAGELRLDETSLVLVTNWFEELDRLAPSDQ